MSSSTTNLCDLPPELVGLIAERTDIISRCVFRKCSKDIRQVVNDSRQVCGKISVAVDRTKQCIYFQSNEIPLITYALEENNCVIRSLFAGCNYGKQLKKTLRGEDYVEVAVNDLMTILKNPKLIIKKLTIADIRRHNEETVPPFTAALHRKLCVLNHKLHVEHISLSLGEEDMLLILPFCKPKSLNRLDLFESEQVHLTRINTMEHWKQAEILHLAGTQPLDDTWHFKQVSMRKKSPGHVGLPWEEFKSFMEKIVAQGEHSPKKFHCSDVSFPQLKEYTYQIPGKGSGKSA